MNLGWGSLCHVQHCLQSCPECGHLSSRSGRKQRLDWKHCTYFWTTFSWKSHRSYLLSLFRKTLSCYLVYNRTWKWSLCLSSHFSVSVSHGFSSRYKKSLAELTLFHQLILERKMKGNWWKLIWVSLKNQIRTKTLPPNAKCTVMCLMMTF